MVQRGQQLGLAVETSQAIGVLRDHRGQHLDRQLALQRRIERLPDDAHPSLADLVNQPVMQKALTRFHGWGDCT